MTKQTIGVYYFVAFALCEIFIEKEKIRKIIISIIPIICGLLIYFIYLYLTNSLISFIDYTILGMIEFKENANIESGIILLALINFFLVGYNWVNKKADKNLKKIFIFSIIMLLITYPILCDPHSRMALIYTLICFAYYVDNIQLKMNFNKEKIEITLLIILLIWNFTICIGNIKNWSSNHIKDKTDSYYGAIYSSINERINSVVEYIVQSEKDVIIVSPEATLYNVELNINNGILDLPLKGNAGLNGKENIINEIKNLSNVKILLTKYIYYQEYPEIHEFIKNNYKKTDEIMGVFEVYE